MRYYFHSGDSDVVSDEDGEVHADDDAACAAALQALSEMLPAHRDRLWKTRRFSVAVKDETGRLIGVFTTLAIFDRRPEPGAPPLM